MKKNFYLLLTIILLFVACENKTNSSEKSTPPSKNKEHKEHIVITPTTVPKKDESYTFNFKNLKNDSSTLNVINDVYHFTNIKQPIVMVSIFSTWCPPCRGQIPHLSNLQKKFKDNLFILATLVHDDIKAKELSKFVASEKMLFFLSSNQKENLKFANLIGSKLKLTQNFTLPLMILFVNGKYFTHYEGNMPEEMIESDIKQALKKIKQNNKK